MINSQQPECFAQSKTRLYNLVFKITDTSNYVKHVPSIINGIILHIIDDVLYTYSYYNFVILFTVGSAPIITTINLQHTLRVDYQPLSYPSNTPVDNYIITPGDISNNPFLNERGPPANGQTQPPDRRSPETYAPQFGNNQFNFNPAPSRGGSNPTNNINFRPQMPSDPSIIYNGNPFFSGTTSRPLGNNPSGMKVSIQFDCLQASNLLYFESCCLFMLNESNQKQTIK